MTEINRLPTATPDILDAGPTSKRNKEGGTVNVVEDQGRVNINRTDSRIEVDDDGSIVFYNRKNAEDPGQENFRILDGKIQTRDGQWRQLPPVSTFHLGNGLKMTVDTRTPENGGKPVSTVTVTDDEFHMKGAGIIKGRAWNEDFGVQIGNVGGNGAMSVDGGGGKLDRETPDGVENAGANFRVYSVLDKKADLRGKIEMDVGGNGPDVAVYRDVETEGTWKSGARSRPYMNQTPGVVMREETKGNFSWAGLLPVSAPLQPQQAQQAETAAIQGPSPLLTQPRLPAG